MKKINCLFLIILLGISGCNRKEEDWLTKNKINLITPTGAPALAFVDYLKSDQFETNTTVSNIAADMIAGNHDIAVMDLVGGLNAISKGAEYSLGALITFGNFYIYSTGNDNDGVMDNNDVILGFGSEASTPIYIFKELYEDLAIDYYVPGVSDTLAVGKIGEYNNKKIDYILTAEPIVTQILNSTQNGSIYSNLQSKWQEKNGEDNSILGAAIFVKKVTYENKKDLINEFLNNVKQSIEESIINPTVLKNKINDYGDEIMQATKLGIKADLAKIVIENGNTVNLGYVGYNDTKMINMIESYLPLVKVNVPNQSVYLK